MKDLFVITITTKIDHSKGDPTFYTNDGDLVGRTLTCRKNERDPNNILYSYDIETTEDVYQKLLNGTLKLYGEEEFNVRKCHISYIRE